MRSYIAPSIKHSSKPSPYIPFSPRKPRPFTPGILTRLSSRWYRHWSTKELCLPVPYIDHVGKFTIHHLGYWYTTPETWFASTTSTVYHRLLCVYSRRSKGSRIGGKVKDLIFNLATFYAFTHSSYAMDRFLANLRPKGLKVLKKLYFAFSSKMDATFRFVHSQTCYQVSWLTFRSKWIRDKSKRVDDIPILEVGFRRGDVIKFYGQSPFMKAVQWTRLNI